MVAKMSPVLVFLVTNVELTHHFRTGGVSKV